MEIFPTQGHYDTPACWDWPPPSDAMLARNIGYPDDVYIFDSVDGCLECCFCALNPHSWTTTDLDEMFRHLAEHRAVGHVVPEYVEEELRADFPNGYDPDA